MKSAGSSGGALGWTVEGVMLLPWLPSTPENYLQVSLSRVMRGEAGLVTLTISGYLKDLVLECYLLAKLLISLNYPHHYPFYLNFLTVFMKLDI